MKTLVEITVKNPENGAEQLPPVSFTYEDDTDTTVSELKGHVQCFQHMLTKLKEASDKRRYHQLLTGSK